MKSFNVIVENINKKEFVSYDVIPYLVNCYKEIKRGTKKPVNFDEFKEFIKKNSMYQWWSRCEYEIILNSWPSNNNEKKIDVYWQIMMNIDIITEIVMAECKKRKRQW